MKSSIMEEAQAFTDYLSGIRRRVHQTPELGMELPNTRQLVMEELQSMGLQPQRCGRMGVTALVEGEMPGGVFLLRADMDALPVREETGLPFAADNANMHACGHDCHVAMLLGAAKLLVAHKAELCGTVKLAFQPGEETMEGAKDMIEAGLLSSPTVQAAMMVHIISNTEHPAGNASVFGGGINYASVDWFRIDILGKGGHGAQPEEAVSPLIIMADVCNHIQQLLTQTVPGGKGAVMSLGEMHGGSVANVIPDTAYLTGTLRTFDTEVRESLKAALSHSVPLLAEAKNGKATVQFGASAPSVVSDALLRADVLQTLRGLLGDAHTFDLETDFDGQYALNNCSEDFAYISHAVPASVVWLYAGSEEQGYCHPCHHPKADFDEAAFPYGAAAYAQCAMDWLHKNR